MSGFARVWFLAAAAAAAAGLAVLAVQAFGAYQRWMQFLTADGQRMIAVSLIVVGLLLGAIGAHRAAKRVKDQDLSTF